MAWTGPARCRRRRSWGRCCHRWLGRCWPGRCWFGCRLGCGRFGDRTRRGLPGDALFGGGLPGRFLGRFLGRFFRSRLGFPGGFLGLFRRLPGGFLRRFLRHLLRRFLGGFFLRRQSLFLGLALLAFFILFPFSHRDPPVAADPRLSGVQLVVRFPRGVHRSVQSWPGAARRPIEKLNRVHYGN